MGRDVLLMSHSVEVHPVLLENPSLFRDESLQEQVPSCQEGIELVVHQTGMVFLLMG